MVPEAGIPCDLVHAGKLNRFLAMKTLLDLGKVPVGCVEAIARLRAFGPDVVLTTGGYVAVPAGFAARVISAPLFVHQQDVTPNLANRMLAPLATTVNVTFAPSRAYFRRDKVTQEGNPIRSSLFGGDRAKGLATFGLDPFLPLLLVTGGSQGARGLNRLLFGALPHLVERMSIVHACGKAFLEEAHGVARCLKPEVQGRYVVRAYLDDDMPDTLAATTLVVARGGASTLSELAALALPAIIVPLPPGFTGSPQRENARFAATLGAALMFDEAELTSSTLTDTILKLVVDAARLQAMSSSMKRLGQLGAADRIAERLLDMAR